jgi:hypothetical protein
VSKSPMSQPLTRLTAVQSIVPGIVGDIFFLHEHAAALSA